MNLRALTGKEALGRLPLLAAASVGEGLVRWAIAEQQAGRTVGHVALEGIAVNAAGALSVSRSAEAPIAPELKVGEAPDTLCDIYWWGHTVYQLLTGHEPDEISPVRPSALNPAVDSSLDSLVLATLAHDAAERPYSWVAVHQQLLGFFELIESPPSLEELSGYAVTLPAVPMMRAVAPLAGLDNTNEQTLDDDDGFQFSSEFAAWRDHNPALQWTRAALSDLRGQVGAALVVLLFAWAVWPSNPKARPQTRSPTVATERSSAPRPTALASPVTVEPAVKTVPYRITTKVPNEPNSRVAMQTKTAP